MRQTSIDCYHEIKEKGLLSDLRFLVYEDIYASELNRNHPTTAGECANRLRVVKGLRQNSVSPRFAELEAMGLIASDCPRECSITNKRVLTWRVTENLPRPLPVRLSSKQIIANLTKEVEWLKSENIRLLSFQREVWARNAETGFLGF